jgi:predicted DNA-binding transcriptional regulator YafY
MGVVVVLLLVRHSVMLLLEAALAEPPMQVTATEAAAIAVGVRQLAQAAAGAAAVQGQFLH